MIKKVNDMARLRYSRDFKRRIIGCIFLTLFFVPFVVYPIVAKIQYKNLVRDMKSTEATIVDIDVKYYRRGPDEQKIYITYEVDGVEYSRKWETDTKINFSAGDGADYAVGDKVKVLYDPQNPEVIAAPRSVGVGNLWLVIALFCLAIPVLTFIWTIKHRQTFLVTQEEYEKEKEEQKKSKPAEKM